jgi:hypothetical protein
LPFIKIPPKVENLDLDAEKKFNGKTTQHKRKRVTNQVSRPAGQAQISCTRQKRFTTRNPKADFTAKYAKDAKETKTRATTKNHDDTKNQTWQARLEITQLPSYPITQ